MEKFNPDQIAIDFKLKGKDPFDIWARKYFTPGMIDTFVPRIPALKSFRITSGLEKFSPRFFEDELAAWAHANNYELNPKEFQNSAGRIIRKAPRDNIKYTVAMEMIYLRSKTN